MVDLHFPLALYKKLLNVKPGLEDLKELSPTEGRYRANRSVGMGSCSGYLWQCGLKSENTTGTSVSSSNHMAELCCVRFVLRCSHTAPCLQLSLCGQKERKEKKREVIGAQECKVIPFLPYSQQKVRTLRFDMVQKFTGSKILKKGAYIKEKKNPTFPPLSVFLFLVCLLYSHTTVNTSGRPVCRFFFLHTTEQFSKAPAGCCTT